MRCIALVNQKGGCGKTTVAVNLSAALAALGRSLLLIDLDPQGHSTLALGAADRMSGGTVHDLLCGERAEQLTLEHVAVPVFEGLDLVGSDLALSTAEQRLAALPGREERLRRKIEQLVRPYEFILIDCPPNLGLLTINALVAASEAIVPMDPGPYSLQGLEALERTLAVLRERLGHPIEKRILPNLIDGRIRYHRRFQELLRERYPSEVLPTTIRRSVKAVEAAAKGRPVIRGGAERGIAEDFRHLAARISGIGPEPAVADVRLRPVLAIPVEFVLESPEAKCVTVAGSFNNWRSDRTFLDGPDESGKWRASVSLIPGQYEYRFIVDGEWIPDPVNPASVVSPFGAKNSLIRVNLPRRRRAEPTAPQARPGPSAGGQHEATTSHG